jgi:hypothetical protein
MIHKNYAFSDSFEEKIEENSKELARVVAGFGECTPAVTIISRDKSSYEFRFVANGVTLTPNEILLYVDNGNLCFGGYCFEQEDGVYTGKVYTD